MSTTSQPEPDPFFAMATLHYGLGIAKLTQDDDATRAKRMFVVLEDLTREFRKVFEAFADPSLQLDTTVLREVSPDDVRLRTAAICRLTQVDPFTPHAIAVPSRIRGDALKGLARDLDVPTEHAERAITFAEVVPAELDPPSGLGLAVGATAAAVVATVVIHTGGLAAGGLGSIGGASGFTSGLAAIGGSMAGGLLIIEVGVGAGTVMTAEALRRLVRLAPVEVIEIGIRTSLITFGALECPEDMADHMTANLKLTREAAAERLNETVERSDPGSAQIKEVERLVDLIARAEHLVDTRLGRTWQGRAKQAATGAATTMRGRAAKAGEALKSQVSDVSDRVRRPTGGEEPSHDPMSNEGA